MKYALGKLDPQFPHAVDFVDRYMMQKPPAPRAVVEPPKIEDWGMMSNDTLGCCVFAGAGHAIMAFNNYVALNDPVPSDQDVASLYLQMTGGQDTGYVIAEALKVWQQQGLWQNKIAAYAPVRQHSVLDLQLAIDIFGLAKLGIQCPESAQEQFGAGQPWTYVPGSPVEGGHDVEAVGYDSEYVYVVTWGKTHPMTYPFAAHFVDEAWAIISQEYTEAGHGPKLDLATLQRDLPHLRSW